MSTLNIYKASAGSGKTFRLALDFMKIVLLNPGHYKRILAVTFTNKATGEMKNRILRELNVLAAGKTSAYLAQLQSATNLSEPVIRERAGEVLSAFLHDYSRFSVSTIDSFFQRVIRNFSREVGINTGYNVELNEEAVLENVIDRLFFNLDDNDALRKWLLDYAENQLKNGDNWNFRREVQRFAKNIFKEEFKELDDLLIQKISDKAFMAGYRKKLNAIKTEFENRCTKLSEQAKTLIDNAGLGVSDFSFGATGVAGYLVNKLGNTYEKPGSRVKNALNAPEKWYTQKTPADIRTRIEEVVNRGVNECVGEVVRLFDEEYKMYASAQVILANLYQLGMLTDLSRELKAYCREEEVMLLSDSGDLLKQVIGESDTPFVYEKIGSYYRHFMIDEFQDTSRLQWNNLKPLIDNALSLGEECLIVGDVKQSIYRWRNGDWKLLAQKVKEELSMFGVGEINMDSNWRSAYNVVAFVNTLFNVAPKLLQQSINSEMESAGQQYGEETGNMLLSAYDGHFQYNRKEDNKGYVQVEWFADDDNAWKAQSLERMVSTIEELQERGYQLRDIAILVRTGKEGQEVVEKLLEAKRDAIKPNYSYEVISSYSLYLESSPAVRFLLGFLRFLNNPDDEVNKAYLAGEYLRYVLPVLQQKGEVPHHFTADGDGQIGLFEENISTDTIEWHTLFSETEQTCGKYFPFFWNKEGKWVEQLKYSALYEAVQRIIAFYGLDKMNNEHPFIQGFSDEVHAFGAREGADIPSFLEWWEVNGKNKTINASEGQNAIRVYTIHKSKGLEFNVVLIPFCNWEMVPKPGTIIWGAPAITPFNELELVPLKYNSRLGETVFANDYFQEKMLSYVDNLNMLYVAFTRAIDELYVHFPASNGKKKTSSTAITRAGNLMDLIINGNVVTTQEIAYPQVNFSDCINDNPMVCIGTKQQVAPGKEKRTPQSVIHPGIMVNDYSGRLKLRNHSEDYFVIDDNTRYAKVNRGKLIHEILSSINTTNDLDRVINQQVREGKITRDEADELLSHISKKMQDPDVKGWFDGSCQVYTERDIFPDRNSVRRPDRVMIAGRHVTIVDFKTGEKEEKTHHHQVRKYMQLFDTMGYEKVDGFLWYLFEDTVKKVTINT